MNERDVKLGLTPAVGPTDQDDPTYDAYVAVNEMTGILNHIAESLDNLEAKISPMPVMTVIGRAISDRVYRDLQRLAEDHEACATGHDGIRYCDLATELATYLDNLQVHDDVQSES